MVAVGCALVIALLGGCGAGQQSQTANSVTMTNGAGGRVGTITIRDAQFGADRQAVAGDTLYRPGQDVTLQLTIVNDVTGRAADSRGPDRLIEVRSPVARASRIAGDTRLPDGQVLVAGYRRPVAATTVPGAREIGISLQGLTVPLRSGVTYPVEFVFARAGSLQLELPVENPQFVKPRAQDPPVYPRPEVGDLPGRPLTADGTGG